jgi:hypothetical protein
MNREDEIVALLNAVLGMDVGAVHRVPRREIAPHQFLRAHSIHRYRDGWLVLLGDHAPCAFICNRNPIGWQFRTVEDMADFITLNLGSRLHNFVVFGERLQ